MSEATTRPSRQEKPTTNARAQRTVKTTAGIPRAPTARLAHAAAIARYLLEYPAIPTLPPR